MHAARRDLYIDRNDFGAKYKWFFCERGTLEARMGACESPDLNWPFDRVGDSADWSCRKFSLGDSLIS